MTLGQRIEQRRKAVGISQAELGRRANVPQSTLNTLINGDARWSPHLVRIARHLGTTVDFLTGESDDPDFGAYPIPVTPEPAVYLQVNLPPEHALTRMFSGLLKGIDPAATRDELAQLLAKRLPIGLSQLRDLQPASTTPPADRQVPIEALEDQPMPDHAPTR